MENENKKKNPEGSKSMKTISRRGLCLEKGEAVYPEETKANRGGKG